MFLVQIHNIYFSKSKSIKNTSYYVHSISEFVF